MWKSAEDERSKSGYNDPSKYNCWNLFGATVRFLSVINVFG